MSWRSIEIRNPACPCGTRKRALAPWPGRRIAPLSPLKRPIPFKQPPTFRNFLRNSETISYTILFECPSTKSYTSLLNWTKLCCKSRPIISISSTCVNQSLHLPRDEECRCRWPGFLLERYRYDALPYNGCLQAFVPSDR